MSKKLFIVPNVETGKFLVGIDDGLEMLDIGEMDGIKFFYEESPSELWTMRKPYPKIKKKEKELISLSKIYTRQKRFKKKCHKNIQECSRKLLEKYGPMTIFQILEKLIEINGGKRKDDISTYRLAAILKGCFNYISPESYESGGTYYLDGQEIPEPPIYKYSRNGWLYTDEAESFYEENAEEFK